MTTAPAATVTPDDGPDERTPQQLANTMRKALRTIDELWPASLTAGQQPGSQAQIHLAPTGRPPLSLHGIDLRSACADIVGGWASLVYERRNRETFERKCAAAAVCPYCAHPEHLVKRASIVVVDWLPPMAGDIHTLCRWLLRHVDWLSTYSGATDAADELDQVARALRNFTQPGSEPTRYLGQCPGCGADLRAFEDATSVKCRECKHIEPISNQEALLLEEARDQLLTASGIARALPGLLGENVSVKRLDNWRAAGRIVPHSTDRNGRALYRVGDVEDVLLTLGQPDTAKPIRGGARRGDAREHRPSDS